MFKGHVVLSVLAASSVVATVLGAAVPAQATSAHGCGYPRVCFYKTSADWKNNHPTAAYRDYGEQGLSERAAKSYYVYNTRNDDWAQITYQEPGAVYRSYLCLLPNRGRAIGTLGAAWRINIHSQSAPSANDACTVRS